MKATELRIGNWVMGNKPFQVTGSLIALYEGRQKLHHDTRTLPEPIPLTTEWLEKFGFDKWSWGYEKNWFISNNGFDRYDVRFIIDVNEGFKSVDFIATIRYEYLKPEFATLRRVTYVHQLQNLYFALTGQEL